MTAPAVQQRIRERAAANDVQMVEAPYLVVVFQRRFFADESVGIAVGLLIAALHDAGLATIVHPPSPLTASLARMLDRPRTEEAFAVLSVGYPQAEGTCPEPIPLDDVLIRI